VVARYRPVVALLSAFAALAALGWYWSRLPGRLWRGLTVAGAVLAAGLAFVARVNVFELMFHPIEHLAFAAAADVKLDKDDKLIVVKIGGSARAYPIRTMGYHHVVNDVVGGTALVATY
jgi:O-antigen ligase